MNEVDTMLQNKAAETAQEASDKPFNIIIHNRISDHKAEVLVLGANTLGQVVQGYGAKIGLKTENNKFNFYNLNGTNKRTTSDLNETIAGFGIGPGDTLGISDEGSVAAG